MTQPTPDNTAIILAEMRGENNAQFKALFQFLELMRSDINRVEQISKERVEKLEVHMNNQFIAMDKRLEVLETSDKTQAQQIASGGISGGITALLIEAAMKVFEHAK